MRTVMRPHHSPICQHGGAPPQGMLTTVKGSASVMDLKFGSISAAEHVPHHPEAWADRRSRAKWGDRIPRLERQADGTEHWVVDGQKIDLPGVGLAGAAMPDRAREPQRWEEVPKITYTPGE